MNLMDVFMVFRLDIILLDLLRQTLTLDGMQVVNHKGYQPQKFDFPNFYGVFFFIYLNSFSYNVVNCSQ